MQADTQQGGTYLQRSVLDEGVGEGVIRISERLMSGNRRRSGVTGLVQRLEQRGNYAGFQNC